MQMRSKLFQGTLKSWSTLCEEACAFASTLAPERIVSISHSCDKSTGVVIVWYWS